MGSIPNALPSGLRELYLNNNAITGCIPSSLPSGLVLLYLYCNQMSGNLPSFPSTLQYLYLGYSGAPGNHFTGSVRLNFPLDLYINDNWITDVVIQDSSVLATGGSNCDLSNNPLLGNSNIAGLTLCTKNGLYSASLLPNTKLATALAKTTTYTTKMLFKSVVITMSVLGTTKLSESSEMTTITLETMDGVTTMTDGTTTMVMTTILQQISISEMACGKFTTLGLASALETVQFVQETSDFAVNLRMMVRVLICAMLLTYVMKRTPFGREFKKMRNKGKTQVHQIFK